MWTPGSCPHGHRECGQAELERWATLPNAITAVRTVLAVGLGLMAAVDRDLTLLLWATGVYWVGDMADGAVARAVATRDPDRRGLRLRLRPGLRKRDLHRCGLAAAVAGAAGGAIVKTCGSACHATC